MSLKIPVAFEPQIQQFAAARHITSDEALFELIAAGLRSLSPSVVSPKDIIGAFASDEERSMADAAINDAMKDREVRSVQDLRS